MADEGLSRPYVHWLRFCKAKGMEGRGRVEDVYFIPKSSEVVTAIRVHVAPNVIPARAQIATSSTSAALV
jgi:hypothetical protein